MRIAVAAAMMAFALAACSQKPEDKAHPKPVKISARDAKAEAAIQNAVAEGGTQAVPKGVPISTPAPMIANPNALPAPFQGKWGMGPADCDISRGDAKGALTIKIDQVIYYEAKGDVQRLIKQSPYQVTADIAFQGEGQEWSTHTRFAITGGGTGLTRTEQSPAKTYHYSRC